MTKSLHCYAFFAIVALGVAAPAHAQRPRRVAPQGVPVRFPEGTVHGFIELHTAAGAFLASGDLIELPRNGGMEIGMSFHFPDSSRFEETVVFTQDRVFSLRSYHLVQRGPAFTQDLDASIVASGKYAVTSRAHDNGSVKTYAGVLEMPPDVSNGMIITLLKNLERRDTQVVHLIAFMPQPRMIELQVSPSGTVRLTNGQLPETAVDFDLKPRVGGITGFFAKLLGKIPPDSHVWIVTGEAPAFVRFEGPLYSGPVWRIDLANPRWPR